ncbi:S-adenosyl-L-methionine-dependent methyltransferase [Zychaea mexicana]|uniref:S-adenosyl-L-methionine-dependent methyltransferase n=1 Tax=Zychaea mexicana TaxID=64656 RepID=UPI0022FF31F1|nr:S-adenosyl-L-methionine-dependent methyltransferase [Zychaea mexicana]KAI9493796.1 S-adenosyl-L-methionine-dependent methyltransferase [Zychaea mexicana]
MGASQSKRKNSPHLHPPPRDLHLSNSNSSSESSNNSVKYRHHSAEPPSPTRQRSASSSHSRPTYSAASQRAVSYGSMRPQHPYPHQSTVAPSIPTATAPPPLASQRRRTMPGLVRRPDDYALHTDSFYLPQDWDAEDRFFAAHLALKRIFGENVAPSVQPKLKPGARVAEIGCGNGPWIMDMAAQYPECQYFGIDTPADLSPSPQLMMLTNIRFHAVELNKGTLPFPANSFDVIYGRALGFRFGVSCWAQLLREMRRILKPGGVIYFHEAHFQPQGSVMIDSFAETLKKIADGVDKDLDLAPKIPQVLDNEGIQVLDHREVSIDLDRNDKISEEMMAILLRAFDLVAPYFAPLMGLDEDEYEQRVEMFCAQCVKHHTRLDWHSYVCVPASFMLSNS